jgi:hypothetical protein
MLVKVAQELHEYLWKEEKLAQDHQKLGNQVPGRMGRAVGEQREKLIRRTQRGEK